MTARECDRVTRELPVERGVRRQGAESVGDILKRVLPELCKKPGWHKVAPQDDAGAPAQ